MTSTCLATVAENTKIVKLLGAATHCPLSSGRVPQCAIEPLICNELHDTLESVRSLDPPMLIKYSSQCAQCYLEHTTL